MTRNEAQETHTSLALEWPLLLERIAEHCVSRVGQDQLRALRPAETLAESAILLARSAEALALRRAGHVLPARDFADQGELFERARAGGVASGVELAALGRLLVLARELRAFARTHLESAPHLAAAISSDAALDRLAERLAACIEADGSVADRAAPELARARARSREIRDDLKRQLGRLLGRFGDLLQGQYYTEREGRYVLPVRSDAHLPVDGIVLGASASGSTLYVEPREITELGNRLRVSEAEAAREEARVLAELSQALGLVALEAETAFFACIVADLCAAIVRWSTAVEAEVPELVPQAELDLQAARHPLLLGAGHAVVPNDIQIRAGQALVISGPNAGGKTVALKTIGLFVWMARAGLPVPALPASRIGFFDPVLCDIGDEQSIVRSLSTFSAHIESLSAMLEASGPGTLILLDEVAAGTDPEEGAALAASVLEALTQRGAAVGVTTHYERLKELAAQGGSFMNASVGFDFERMQPTFRLVLGVPGASSALHVAGRHGLPESVLLRARALLPAHAIDREAAVRELERERAALEVERREAQSERLREVRLREELEAERSAFRERAAREVEDEVRELRSSVRSARKELETIRGRVRAGGADSTELRALERGVSRVAAQVAVGGALVQRGAEGLGSEHKSLDEQKLAVGCFVRHKSFGTLAEVLEAPERGQVRLLIGNMKLNVALSEIEAAPAHAKPNRQKSPKKLQKLKPVSPLASAHRGSENTLDLRGTRLDDALARVDAFLDRMLSAGEPAGFVLHGHGTGALKTGVREHLANSAYVEHVRPAEPDEGGDAFTVFWIRG